MHLYVDRVGSYIFRFIGFPSYTCGSLGRHRGLEDLGLSVFCRDIGMWGCSFIRTLNLGPLMGLWDFGLRNFGSCGVLLNARGMRRYVFSLFGFGTQAGGFKLKGA